MTDVVVVQSLSRVQLFATRWTVAHQALLSMGFPRQEYWSGLSVPSLGDLPPTPPRIKPRSLALQTDSLLSEPPGKPFSYKLMDKPKLLGQSDKAHFALFTKDLRFRI